MYEADAIVTGTDMRQRPWGFAQTLRDVLVRSSGNPRLKDDPRTAELAVHADRFVACFNYVDMMAGVPLHDDQGTYDRPHKLTVYFDPAKIDAVLAQFDDKPWHGERPVVVPVLLVHARKPPAYVLSAEIRQVRNSGARSPPPLISSAWMCASRTMRSLSLGVPVLVIFRPIRRHQAPVRRSSPVRSTGVRHCLDGSGNGGCAGKAPITHGASAASLRRGISQYRSARASKYGSS